MGKCIIDSGAFDSDFPCHWLMFKNHDFVDGSRRCIIVGRILNHGRKQQRKNIYIQRNSFADCIKKKSSKQKHEHENKKTRCISHKCEQVQMKTQEGQGAIGCLTIGNFNFFASKITSALLLMASHSLKPTFSSSLHYKKVFFPILAFVRAFVPSILFFTIRAPAS